jgi:hypothetical protein
MVCHGLRQEGQFFERKRILLFIVLFDYGEQVGIVQRQQLFFFVGDEWIEFVREERLEFRGGRKEVTLPSRPVVCH